MAVVTTTMFYATMTKQTDNTMTVNTIMCKAINLIRIQLAILRVYTRQ
jgi:hypothetical protein